MVYALHYELKKNLLMYVKRIQQNFLFMGALIALDSQSQNQSIWWSHMTDCRYNIMRLTRSCYWGHMTDCCYNIMRLTRSCCWDPWGPWWRWTAGPKTSPSGEVTWLIVVITLWDLRGAVAGVTWLIVVITLWDLRGAVAGIHGGLDGVGQSVPEPVHLVKSRDWLSL